MHTPAPWTIRSEPDEPNAGGRYAKHHIEPLVAKVFYTNETGASNARLIAAAPELLAALKALCDASADSSQSKFADSVAKSRAAIAKAEGK